MLAATRRWVKRYRVPIALSFGVVGAGYLVTNYVVNKLRDARERMTSDRIAKEKCVFPLSPRSRWTYSRHEAAKRNEVTNKGIFSLVACAVALSRIRRTVPSRCLHSSRPPRATFSRP